MDWLKKFARAVGARTGSVHEEGRQWEEEGHQLEAEAARCWVCAQEAGEEGVEEGGKWGLVTRESSGVESTAASRQVGVQVSAT